MEGINKAPVIDFLLAVCPPVLDCSREELMRLLTGRKDGEKIQQFIADAQIHTLVVGKEILQTESEKADEEPQHRLFLDLEVSFKGSRATIIAFAKRPGFNVVDTGGAGERAGEQDLTGGRQSSLRHIGGQLQMITLGYMDNESSPFELVHTYLQNSFAPLFNTYRSEGGDDESKGQDETKIGIPNVQKKIAELAMSCMQCQQNVEIPEISLTVDPEIREAAARSKSKGTKLRVEDFAERLEDPSFLNQIQSGVNRWIKEIQKVTRLSRDPTTGSAMQEINFWLGLERALNHAHQQLQTPEIELTLNLLKQAKRFLATISFEADTGLKPAMEKVSNIIILMRDFPINDLLAATTVDQLTYSIRSIFSHMRKIKNATLYPLLRAFNLVEAVSRDLAAQILKVLSSQRLMQLEYEEFDHATAGCNELFRLWEDEVRNFKDLVREQVKKRGTSERPPPKLNCEHTALQERIEDLRKFRRQHQKLKEVISKVLTDGRTGGEMGAHREITSAYKLFLNIDVLDVSRSGTEAWEQAKKAYDDKIDRAESQITSKLRDRLGAAKTASEMFRVFSRFNALFFRPRIRGAIQEYQSSLIQQVKDDIRKLQNKFKEHYTSTQAAKMATVRDIPPTSGAIIWAKQLERRLQVYMRRVEDVLGKGWEQHIEGQKLKQDGDAFAKKLNTMVIFDNWLKDIKDVKSFDVGGRIFDVHKNGDNDYELVVNYDQQIITLFKEVRNLQCLQFRVPYSVKVTSDEAKLNYPFAMTLLESVRTYTQSCSKVDDSIAPLVASYQKEVNQLIMDGIHLKWDSDRLESYARRFADQVFLFQDKVTDLLAQNEQMQRDIESLAHMPLAGEGFKEVMEKLQKMVDDMNLANFSNLSIWVDKVDKHIQSILITRLRQLVEEWVKQFTSWPDGGTTLIESGTLHELKMQNQQLYLDPPKEGARQTWICNFHSTLGTICNLSRIQSARFDAFAKGGAQQVAPREQTYSHLLKELDTKILEDAYAAVERIVDSMEEYVKTWLQYQSLWDIESSTVFNRLGDDIETWQHLLNEIKASRATFDNSETQRTFGPIIIDYRAVQSKVNNKYDAWHKEILNSFGHKVGDQTNTFYNDIQTARFNLEKISLEGAGSDVTAFVTAIQETKKNAAVWAHQMEHLRASQKLLERQRFAFPQEWLWLDRVEGEWEAFEQILGRKAALMEREIPNLKTQIIQKDRLLDEKIKQAYAEWSSAKPLQGNVRPNQAMDTLSVFESRLGKLNEEYDKVVKAKELLDMDVGTSDVLAPLREEVENLKGVWTELSGVYSLLETLKETPWSAVVPKKVRQGLNDVLEKLKALPPKLRQYEAFEHMQLMLKSFLKLNVLLVEMKTEALKERHWKILLQKLRLTVHYPDLTLGHLWDADLPKNEASIKEILAQAQGEMALEEFLRQVKEIWGSYELDLVVYQNKCRLIRAWDELFAQIDEHLSSLTSMKLSPYFKVFEEEALAWDEKLNRWRVLFDTWMDVQRKWVYLEGIFYGSADIQTLLPNEYSRFRTIDNDFIAIMKKVTQRPKDLLEMIGNSRDVKVVQRHLNKMFAGITALELDTEDPDQIVGMSSREGEVVHFKSVVKISDDPAINAWLSRVEQAMQNTLGALLEEAVDQYAKVATGDAKSMDVSAFLDWVKTFPAQIVLLAVQVDWSERVEKALKAGSAANVVKALTGVEDRCVGVLNLLADQVLTDVEKKQRQKYEQLITELVHQRDVIRSLKSDGVAHDGDFKWLQMMRMYWNPKESDPLKKLVIKMANASFEYGFEYLGIGEKLVQTPLTDRCYLTLTQALHMRLGGNPFGPAGTGKTETVKALGTQLGRFVLVFCCDESFDNNAIGRIFVGLCQVGAWGCFDEFNRLEERILSAVSEQILTIQTGLKEQRSEIEMLQKTVRLNPNMGIFVTMNPGYAGRSNLPDNLKQLFREMAMIKPDKELIAQVMLYSQGFRTAERLAGKIVSLFDLCQNQLSNQPHYDFGLRSLKSVLNSAGNLKRQSLQQRKDDVPEGEKLEDAEQKILLRSVCDTLVPKLVAQDVPLLRSLMSGVFPGADIMVVEEAILTDEIKRLCRLRHLQCTNKFLEKVLQLYQIQNLCHGVMMVGNVGSGKSTAWRLLIDAMTKVDGRKGESYVVDPKAVTKDELYGKLDPTTLEWTDGVFTDILRRILMSLRGEKDRRHWIVFDGDVDPEWAENLNSVLDDNKLLTLPNGERLQIPSNVRIMFEVETLKYATLATVSRCGMVWFSEDVIAYTMVFHNHLNFLQYGVLEDEMQQEEEVHKIEAAVLPPEDQDDPDKPHTTTARIQHKKNFTDDERRVRERSVEIMKPFFEHDGFVIKALEKASEFEHIMVFTPIRVLEATFSLIRKGVNMIVEYNENHMDFPMSDEAMQRFLSKWLVISVLWGMGGAMSLSQRAAYATALAALATTPLPSGLNEDFTLLDFEARLDDGEWHPWRQRVPQVDIEPHRATDADLVIVTVDTLRHRSVLAAWLEEKKPFILCGPPGSGKTMTLMSTLKGLADFDMASLNFSSGSTPELLLKTFDHYCEYVKTPGGVILRPSQPGKWLIVFCDEINLPTPDKYGTQRVIMFIRQMTEAGGFWRPSDRQWVKLERVQFVGACNPPTDAGRSPMSDRFLRHAPLIFVDFPGAESLKQIYGTFNRGILKMVPSLRNHGDALTNAMVEFYRASQKRFTVDMQPHYIYSPRELTRWKVAIYEAIKDRDDLTLEGLVRLWAHEGLRIFQDRLVELYERTWTDEKINEIALQYFTGVNESHLKRPILFSCYNAKNYEEIDREELRTLIQSKLRVFYEEELSVQLVIFDQVLDHITRIDRVLRQPLGHLLLVGASGAGKTVLSKFVSWMNGLSVFQIKAGRNYDTTAFEADLRHVMKRAGIKEEKITFIFDESNALGPAFLERMNALLAAGEVPGLFEGDEYSQLMSECKAAMAGDIGVDEGELFSRFTKQVQRNLHIVFTMNPANPDFANRQATSPALFNRCIIDWFGDWPHDALVQVAREFTGNMELARDAFVCDRAEDFQDDEERHMAVANAIVFFHEKVDEMNQKLMRAAKKYNYVTPRDYLDFINHFLGLVEEKREEVMEQQKHLNVGLTKLKETEQQVAELQVSLAEKDKDLAAKNKLAEEKMQVMVKEQADAEEKKKEAERMQKELDKKAAEIAERAKVVRAQLAEAEPALIEAKNSVKNISKKNLDELRNMPNPPSAVKLALEAVVVLLTQATAAVTWDDIKKAIKGGDFINQVLNFDSEGIQSKTRVRVERDYLKSEEWDTAKIDRASKAAGPLALWVESQFSFAKILESVEPLQQEIRGLENEKNQNQRELDKAKDLIATLEGRIDEYKREYADLISKVQIIKREMETVQSKVERSISLLNNLASEKDRWAETSQGFQQEMGTIVGDCLLAGAFCTYIGFFDHYYRNRLSLEWRENLETLGIRFRDDLSLIDYLSKPSERLQWTANALPADDLSTENAIVLKRFIRYPLIIDPSGQATNFIINEYAEKRLMKTSFADTSFMKNLESALRFGTPLLVQDVERVDPILNPVLNQETHKQGGRVLINVGDAEIDFSPSFTMFLSTRDPTAQFTPDLCSRVTFVNFTVTPSSLQNQCMNLVLKSERPDVDKKRSDMLKLQGEFRVKIRELEDSLLMALSNVKGNILDDDSVIATLETLKKQAAQVAQEAARTDAVMDEIDLTSQQYMPLAQSAARIFFSMEQLGTVYFLYQHSLQFFLDIFHDALRDQDALSKVGRDDYTARLGVIFDSLFRITFQRVARGLQWNDRLVFAIRLSQIRSDNDPHTAYNAKELDLLMKGAGFEMKSDDAAAHDVRAKRWAAVLDGKLNTAQAKGLHDLEALPCFANTLLVSFESKKAEWRALLDDMESENKLPQDFALDDKANPNVKKIRDALVIRALRPDRLIAALNSLIDLVLGKGFLWLNELNLQRIAQKETKSLSPLVLVSAPGFDPSSQVVELAHELNKPMQSIAMGSQEGYQIADKAINAAAKNGTWVLLKNVHLSTRWLQELEKKLHRLNPHEHFRIFLTMEINPNVPLNLLRVSTTIVFEPPVGVKASLQRSYSNLLSIKRSDRTPVERSRLHFLLAMLHAIVLERKRYAPVGWTKRYEFSDADQQCALDTIDYWLDAVSNNGTMTNVRPEKIPWDALRTVLKAVIYGGRVDNEFDHRVLSSFVDHLFCEEAFTKAEYVLCTLVEGVQPLKSPESGRKRENFISWVEALPDKESPAWLGLPIHAEQMLQANQGTYTMTKLLLMQGGEDDLRYEPPAAEAAKDVTPTAAGAAQADDKGGPRPRRGSRRHSMELGNWLSALLPKIQSLLMSLPSGMEKLVRTAEAVQNPLFRCFDREVNVSLRLLHRIKSDLEQLQEVCSGKMKTTNELRALALNISADTIPKDWKRYSVAEYLTATQWLADFTRRIAQLKEITKTKDFGRHKLWMGGLLFPEAYLTATRQAVAQHFHWSLEELFLCVEIGNTQVDDQSFIITGMAMEGAAWDANKKCLTLTEELSVELPPARFRWTRRDDPAIAHLLDPNKALTIPVYLTDVRRELVTSVRLPIPSNIPTALWIQRSATLIIWRK
ncbi:unnamed protein product [Vitrella brassicaformis CCMP3155]|uniref:Dynein heavy chain, cytoplasmic n=1 Tax=Vitrella brassicaformis (strain CCMP3155) TaxID=1169540 RepID=A0A0G4FPR4_VITBC|nr:unnamed protein product [Vitrella brassicaformis CCMP3155]|eukprot:CEM16453.1 unnamed protein product [Vitrella brassicaformis CCMP3155]